MKKVLKTSRLLIIPALAALIIYSAGCGSGGGGINGSNSANNDTFVSRNTTVTGAIDNLTMDSAAVGREAGRTASASVAISDYSGFTVTAGGATGTISGNIFTVKNVPAGNNILVTIAKNKILLKAYIPVVEPGVTVNKPVGVASTAAAVFWEKLGKPGSTSVESLELDYDAHPTTAAIKDVVTAITNAIKDPATASLPAGKTCLDVKAVTDDVAAAQAAAFTDTTPPTIMAIFPNNSYTDFAPSSQISIDFNEKMTTTAPFPSVSAAVKDVTDGTATTTVAAPAVSWDAGAQTLIVNHGVVLGYGKTYLIVLTLNPSTIKDAAGNALLMPSAVSNATVNTKTNTITALFTTSFQVTSYVDTTPAENTAATISGTGGGDTTFARTFFGGANIKTSGATYAGQTACAACHASIITTYATTHHAQTFALNGKSFTSSCLQCHTVDGDKIPTVVINSTKAVYGAEGAFGLPWTDYSKAATSTVAVSKLGGIQCEDCHGPASLHISGNGDKNFIVAGSQALAATTCEVCHDAPTHHTKPQEWRHSKHSITRGTHTDPGCNPCHTGEGFLGLLARKATNPMAAAGDGLGTVTAASAMSNINCATCHDPHEAKAGNDPQLRLPANQLCITCHGGRKRAPVVMTTGSPVSGGSPHYSLAGQMLNGEGGVDTNGKMYYGNPNDPNVPNGYATQTVQPVDGPAMGSTKCVDCHMYSNAAKSITAVHNFQVVKAACTDSCHPGMDAGIAIGKVQSEFTGRYNLVSTRLAKATAANKATPFTGNNMTLYLNASWNLNFVNSDRSKGFHNPAYAKLLMDNAAAMLTKLGY